MVGWLDGWMAGWSYYSLQINTLQSKCKKNVMLSEAKHLYRFA